MDAVGLCSAYTVMLVTYRFTFGNVRTDCRGGQDLIMQGQKECNYGCVVKCVNNNN